MRLALYVLIFLAAPASRAQPLMEQLFARGTMAMDQEKNTAIVPPAVLARAVAASKAELARFRWLEGEWTVINSVPATKRSPAYTGTVRYTFQVCEDETTICLSYADRNVPFLRFDGLASRWISLMPQRGGTYGFLQSEGWKGESIVFEGRLLMLGVDWQVRQTWTRRGPDEFRMENRERTPRGAWRFADEFVYRRR